MNIERMTQKLIDYLIYYELIGTGMRKFKEPSNISYRRTTNNKWKDEYR